MAIADGLIFNGNKITCTANPGQVANFVSGGVGRMNNGSIALDTGAIVGNNFWNGIAQNASGALYVTASIVPATDVYIGGTRRSAAGALVFQFASPAFYGNGNGFAGNGEICVI